MLLDCEPVPLAELPVPLAELPVPLPLAEPVPALLPLIDPPWTMRPRISTWLFAYLVRFSCCVPATRMYLSPLAPLADDPVPDVAEPLVDPVAEPLVLEPVPLVPALVPPLMDDDPLPIFAFVRTNCELLVPVAELDDPVAELEPVPDVPVVPAMSAVCRHPVTVTCCCVLELEPCWLLLEPVEPDCALSVPASAIESTVPNTTLRFIYTS
jgi:hypothetical protein